LRNRIWAQLWQKRWKFCCSDCKYCLYRLH